MLVSHYTNFPPPANSRIIEMGKTVRETYVEVLRESTSYCGVIILDFSPNQGPPEQKAIKALPTILLNETLHSSSHHRLNIPSTTSKCTSPPPPSHSSAPFSSEPTPAPSISAPPSPATTTSTQRRSSRPTTATWSSRPIIAIALAATGNTGTLPSSLLPRPESLPQTQPANTLKSSTVPAAARPRCQQIALVSSMV